MFFALTNLAFPPFPPASSASAETATIDLFFLFLVFSLLPILASRGGGGGDRSYDRKNAKHSSLYSSSVFRMVWGLGSDGFWLTAGTGETPAEASPIQKEAQVLCARRRFLRVCWLGYLNRILDSDKALDRRFFRPGLRIRIRIIWVAGSGKEISCFEVLYVIFWGLKASPVAWASFMEA